MNQKYPWITNKFLKNVLEKYFQENVEILKFALSPAIPVGENYTSDLTKISVTYKDSKGQKDTSIITKTIPNDEALKNYADDLKFFEQEIGFYNEIVPALNRLDYVNKISPDSIFASEKDYVIMLQDLTTLGFKSYPREIGLDLKHSLLLVEKMAYLHASSVALYQQNPSLVTKYNIGLFWDNPFSVRWISIGIKELIRTCGECSYLNKYVDKLKSVQKHILETGFASTKPTGSFNVLNHGDLWTNNCMFSYNENDEVKDIMFIDYQVVLYSSPALDLNYFWASSPNPTVLECHLDTVLDSYYNTFTAIIQKLRVSMDVPNRKQFRDEFNSRAIYGLICLLTVSPLVTGSRRSDANFDQFMNNDCKTGFRYHCYNNERYKSKLVHLLNLYDSLGILS